MTYKSKNNQTTYSRNGRKDLVNGKVDKAILDSTRGINRCFVIVSLNDGTEFDFPVPTSQEIRERFFYKNAKTRANTPARPPNKFFIFRTMLQVAIENRKLQVPIVSGLASEVWKKCSPEVIELFTKLSQIAKNEHSEINPGYVYKPNRSKSRITKNKSNSPQEKSCPNLNNPPSPDSSTASFWASNYQEHLYLMHSQANFNPDENSVPIEDSQDIQAYLNSVDHPDITSPTDTFSDINDPHQHQFLYPTPMNNAYYPNYDLLDQFSIASQDMNALMQPNLLNLSTIPNHHIHYLPSTINHINDDYNDYNDYNELFYNSPISECEDMTLSSPDISQLQESGCIDHSPDYVYEMIQNLTV